MIKIINTILVPEQKKLLLTPCIYLENILPIHDALIEDLIDTATANKGCIGLTANQIWKDPNVPAPAIFIVPGISGWAVCINPNIERTWKKIIKGNESCMSVPDTIVSVERPRHIVVSFYDGSKALQHDIHMFDIAARIFQHELDHINGKLIYE